jgi:hypothetical protein
MLNTHVANVSVHEAAQSITDDQRLMRMVENMAAENEELAEENAQLRAAIAIYREVLARYTGKVTRSAA